MKMERSLTGIPLIVGFAFLIALVVIEILAILKINNGFLVYTLDDPYIHLALAENLKHGHYGVNSSEFSAPSSSILWPFIVTPFSNFEFFPLLINIVFAMLTVYIFVKIMDLSFELTDKRKKIAIFSLLAILLILGTNLVGLIFTGMEHSLQVLLVSLIAWGLVIHVKQKRLETWFLVAIVVAPLIRYENMSVSVAAICYLLLCKYYSKLIPVTLLIAVFVGGFSIFLVQLGLDPMPSSVNVKSTVVESGGTLSSLAHNLVNSLSHPMGTLIAFGVLGLTAYVLLVQHSIRKQQLAMITILALALHLVAGRYGWYNRYEAYIWTFFLLISISLLGEPISRYLGRDRGNWDLLKVVVLACAFIVLANSRYIFHLFTLPIASNNIYAQQYQMHRFAVDYYKKPVAVNDLGYVSYKNNSYVLDLWGLASIDARKYRKKNSDPGWMNKLAQTNNVELAMIYEHWFGKIPDEWIKVGKLHFGGSRITAAGSDVDFFAMNKKAYSEIFAELKIFKETLPNNVSFIFEEVKS